MGFTSRMQGFFNICQSISVIHNINRLKTKNHMIISIHTGKAFDKIKHLFMIKKKKNLQKTGIQETYHSIIKRIYDNLQPASYSMGKS